MTEYLEIIYKKLSMEDKIFGGIKDKLPLSINTNKSGRFVKLELQIKTSFHLDEVEIYDESGLNIAIGSKTIASSSYNDLDKYSGINLTNGSKTGGVGYHSKRECSPWIVIDLGKERKICKV